MSNYDSLRSLITATLANVLGYSLIAIFSKIFTGGWLNVYTQIPQIIWIFFITLIIFWVIIIRLNQINQSSGGAIIFDDYIPSGGGSIINNPIYAGVKWRVRLPSWPDPHLLKSSQISIETPPRCPNCETQIEESKSFWIGYVWKCVSCGFKKRNRDDYYKEAERVKKREEIITAKRYGGD